MKQNGTSKFILAIGIQIAILLLIVEFKLMIFVGGTEIILETEPIDPRSPLRGDYLTVQYKISTIPMYKIQNGIPNPDQSIFVVLKQNGMYWDIDHAELSKPRTTGSLYLKGKITSVDSIPNVEAIETYQSSVQQVRVLYGIEQYYIPEGSGRKYNGTEAFKARVVVDDTGNAVVKKMEQVEGN